MIHALSDRSLRLLHEMGIDVWRLRRTGGDRLSAGGGQRIPAGRNAPEVAPETDSAVSERPDPGKRTMENRVPAGEVRRPAPGGEQAPAVAPFTVLCLSRPDAVLLIEPSDAQGARRFAADLLSAATGEWGGETRQLAFDWPQPGIEASASSAGRALGAFVDKQLADHDGALILIGAEVAARLPDAGFPEASLILPPIDALMTEASLKRTLWEALGQHSRR